MNDTTTPDNGFRCLVDFDLYRRAMMCVSTEETRYYLRGVHIEPLAGGGVLLVATDGSSMLCFRDPTGVVRGGGSAIVRLDSTSLRMGTKAKPISGKQKMLAVAGDKASVVFVQDERTAEMEDNAIEMALSPDARVVAHQWCGAIIDGTYPDWRRVVPVGEMKPIQNSIDAARLAKIVKALAGDDAVPSYQAWQIGGEIDPILIRTTGVDGFGIIMPFHVRMKPGYPSWFEGVR